MRLALRGAVGIGTALLLATPTVAPAQGNLDRQIRENERRLREIRAERQELQAELTRLRSRLHNITTELQNIERQKSATNRIVNELDRQLRLLNDQLDTATMDLVLTQDALAEKRAVLRRRLVDIYKRGPLWAVQVLLAAESFGDLLSRYKYLYLVSRQDRALVHEVEELRDRIADQRQQLVVLQTQLSRRRDDRNQELSRYVSLERQRSQALRETRANQRQATTRLDSLARSEEQLTSLLERLELERRRAVARGERAPEGALTEADLGTLEWPVDGEVLYRFGPAPGPDQTRITYHGVGIAAALGTPVRAVAAGVVSRAAPYGTYGPSIILDHGGGFYTLYLYLSRFDVRPGDRVERGQVIGQSGGTASDHGPHIEFQIRQATDAGHALPLDPENWLQQREQ